MAAMGQLAPESCQNILFLGELNLSGGILPIRGVLPVVSDKLADNMHTFVVPKDNLREAKLVKDARVYGFSALPQVIAYLKREDYESQELPKPSAAKVRKTADFSDVNGQLFLKRAAEIAASGMHNMLIVGPPGAGKTMISERIASILPPLTEEEKLELSKIYSICGLLSGSDTLLSERPFRSPHHTVSPAGLAGGGADLRPGEISLAHHGVLFLDELPEFHRDVLETLRQPLEDGEVTVTRAGGTLRLPARFQLVCAMNPCRCGWRGHPSGRCACTDAMVEKYVSRISGPLLDRMDLHVEVPSVEFEAMRSRETPEYSAAVKERVDAARAQQNSRFAGTGISCNAQMTPAMAGRFCTLDSAGEKLLESAFRRMGLTARSHDRILRVARTIADLDGEETISAGHLAEAIQYRNTDILKG